MNTERALDRMRRTAEEADRQAFVAVLVSPSPDLAYLTGYDPVLLERPTLLVLRADADPVMLVPELERPLAAASPAGAAIELMGWKDGVDPYAAAAGLLPASGRVAAADRLWSSHLLALQAAAPALSFAPASPVIGRLRARKDPDELDALRRAGAAADRTFEDICSLPFAGRRERDVAADLARLLVAHGHAQADFEIVASGPNAASPHHHAGDRVIEADDAVVLDFGGVLDGYCSDTTRTVVVGEPPEGFAAIFDIVRAAQAAACDVVRPGIAAQEVDRAARQVIEDAGYGERFFHRVGHGIGMEVHEPPYIVEGNETILEPGVTFSIEPGIYLEGRFGARIEDIVAVTHDGIERFNTSPRDLRIVT